MDAAVRRAFEFVRVDALDGPARLARRVEHFAHTPIVAMREANRIDAPGAQRLEHGVDAVDDHRGSGLGTRGSGLGTRGSEPERAARNAAARSRQPRILGKPESSGNSAPRSIAGIARSSSGPSARPVSATRIG